MILHFPFHKKQQMKIISFQKQNKNQIHTFFNGGSLKNYVHSPFYEYLYCGCAIEAPIGSWIIKPNKTNWTFRLFLRFRSLKGTERVISSDSPCTDQVWIYRYVFLYSNRLFSFVGFWVKNDVVFYRFDQIKVSRSRVLSWIGHCNLCKKGRLKLRLQSL